MRMVDIIIKKRNGEKLSREEIEFVVDKYLKNEIPDYQMSALLMAIYFKGMDEEETSVLTEIMANSGKIIDLTEIPGIKIDKHSTGGVGDKTTLVFAPLIASYGFPIAKMSGRSLGHTGGTIDKLESIPGFRTNLTLKELINQVKKIGISIVGQTENLVPADKKIYALRDVTGTVDSIPLIASSIMSKKIAGGSDIIVLDVKVGRGAFIDSIDKAEDLALLMVKIGKRLNKKISAVISDMNEPLGNAVGNSLEVIEAIETLKGKGPSDLKELVINLGIQVVLLSGKEKDEEKIRRDLEKLLNEGLALKKFRELIRAQGGNDEVIDNYKLFPQAKIQKEIFSREEGYITKMDAYLIAKSVILLGAGRDKKEDIVDLSVGIKLHKKLGDKVYKNEPIVTFFANDPSKLALAQEVFKEAYEIGEEKINKKLILKVIK
ncbi:MAG: pyrimidine-nucleoside phosphorylase [Dictyoglomus sp.]|nr:pyrimidine-nucleoside phosphorylase [Dictyoglomus sp.]MCX7942522.1 pyrimidine-nucleoside phosphorylase [Dictyoglomaceae bacterium]MDW8188760.1 pyrimidine-nucleoside phosphorylase [Dictyoglomus sp.]